MPIEKGNSVKEENSLKIQGCFLYTPRRPYTALKHGRMVFKQESDTVKKVSETDPKKEPEKLVKSQSALKEDHQAAVSRVRVANTVDDEIARRKAAWALLELKGSA